MTEQEQPAAATAPGAETPAPQDPKPTDTVDFWKAQARENEKRAKANADAAARLAQLEESQKTEAQKLHDAADEARREATEAKAEALRYRIATKFGISDEDAATFLTGTDEETVTKQAERLAALNAQSSKTPKPDKSQGSKGGESPLSGDPGQQFGEFLSGQLSR